MQTPLLPLVSHVDTLIVLTIPCKQPSCPHFSTQEPYLSALSHAKSWLSLLSNVDTLTAFGVLAPSLSLVTPADTLTVLIISCRHPICLYYPIQAPSLSLLSHAGTLNVLTVSCRQPHRPYYPMQTPSLSLLSHAGTLTVFAISYRHPHCPY